MLGAGAIAGPLRECQRIPDHSKRGPYIRPPCRRRCPHRAGAVSLRPAPGSGRRARRRRFRWFGFVPHHATVEITACQTTVPGASAHRNREPAPRVESAHQFPHRRGTRDVRVLREPARHPIPGHNAGSAMNLAVSATACLARRRAWRSLAPQRPPAPATPFTAPRRPAPGPRSTLEPNSWVARPGARDRTGGRAVRPRAATPQRPRRRAFDYSQRHDAGAIARPGREPR